MIVYTVFKTTNCQPHIKQSFKLIQIIRYILLAGDVLPLSELADSSELLGSTNSTSKYNKLFS